MTGKFSARGLLFLAVLSSFTVFAADGMDWNPEIYPENQIFPALVIGAAGVKPDNDVFGVWKGNHLGDPQGIVGATLDGVPEGGKISLEVRENDFMHASRLEGVAESGEQLSVHPKISWKYDKLSRVKQAVPVEVTMELKVDGQSCGEKPSPRPCAR